MHDIPCIDWCRISSTYGCSLLDLLNLQNLCHDFISIYNIASKFVLYKKRHLIPTLPTSSAHRSAWVLYLLCITCWLPVCPCHPLQILLLGHGTFIIILIMYLLFVYTCTSKAQQMSFHTACTGCKKGVKQLCLSLFVRKCSNISINIYVYMHVLHMICVLNFPPYSSDPPSSETKPLCRMCTSLSRERHVLSRAIINL